MEHTKSELYRRNFWLLILEGTFILGAIGFFNSNTVIPVFIDKMTGSKKLVGLTLTLISFSMYFGRLLIGPFMPMIRNHVRFTSIFMFLTRPLLILPALFIFAGYYKESVIILIICITAMWIGDGIVVPPWSEVFANTIDNNRHGRLLGWQMLFGGLTAIGAGTMVNIFLANPLFDIKLAFGWIFLTGGLLATLSCIVMSFCKNAPQNKNKNEKVNILKYYTGLPKYLKLEKDFSRIMSVQFILLLAAACIPFIILFADNEFKLNKNNIALLILVQSAGMPLGGWIWGQACDKLGVHNAVKLAGANITLICALPLFALIFKSISPMVFLAPNLFLSGVASGIWSCYYIYTIQAVRPESRAPCLVLSSIIILPASFSSYLAGIITEASGFVVLFIICLFLSIAGFILTLRLRPIKAIIGEWNREGILNE